MMRWVLAAGVLMVLLAACGGNDDRPGGAVTPGVTSGQPGPGVLIVANLDALVEYDIESGNQSTLLQSPATNSFLLDPAVSPDGASIAYVQQPPPKVEEGKFDAGSDLWVMARDGSNPRLVFQHVQPNQLVRFPRFEGPESILAIVQEISTQDGITRVVYTLQRIEVATGERESVMEDVLAFDISSDGQRLVVARLLPQTGEALHASALDGGGSTELVGAEQLLAPFSYPRFSPDGKTVAFASADQTGARAAVQLVSLVRGSGGRFEPTAAPAAVLDGLPQDIWTVDATGGQAVRVADLKEDLPALTWDGAGEHLYVIGVAGLYDVDLRSGAVARLGEGAFHAQLAWSP